MVLSLFIALCSVVIALFGVLKAYLEYAETKTKTVIMSFIIIGVLLSDINPLLFRP